MMKKLMCVACFLIVFGSAAMATHAQTPVDPFAGDSHVILNGPDPCGMVEKYCVDLTYTGTGTGFFFLAPPTPLPGPPPETCAADNFRCKAIDGPCLPLSLKEGCFYGFLFYDFMGDWGQVPGDADFSLYTNSPITLSLAGTSLVCTGVGCDGPDVTFTPEPGTALLYMTGLALLVGFGRKRFRANCVT